MSEEKELTIEDILTATEKREIKIPWQEGYLKCIIRGLKRGEVMIARRAAGNNNEKFADQLIKMAVESPSLTSEQLDKLPMGLVVKLEEEIMKLSGFSEDDIKKFLR